MSSKKTATLLIVDDEPDMRDIIAAVGSHLGYDTVRAGDGLEALEHLKSNQIDVIVSDVMMPRMTGLQLLEKVREVSTTIPFVIVTGYSAQEMGMQALKLGAFDLIHKPFDMSHFSQILKEAVRVSHDFTKSGQDFSLDHLSNQTVSDIERIKTQAGADIRRLKALSEEENLRRTEEVDLSNATDSQQRLIAEFCVEALSQLQEAGKALAALADIHTNNWEMGYLFRVFQTISMAAKNLKLKDVHRLCHAMEECFANFRVRPRMLAASRIQDLRRAHQIIEFMLRNQLRGVQDEELKALCNEYCSKINLSSFKEAS